MMTLCLKTNRVAALKGLDESVSDGIKPVEPRSTHDCTPHDCTTNTTTLLDYNTTTLQQYLATVLLRLVQ